MQTEEMRFAADASRTGPKSGPQRTTRLLLLAVALGLCDQMYWNYSFVDRAQKGYWYSFVAGVGLAPEQYRIGVKLAAWWMVRHFGWGFRHAFTLMDVIGTLIALYGLYALLERRRAIETAGLELRWFASAAFVALSLFYLAWVGSYFRPETLPTCGLVAVMLWLWSLWERGPSSRRRRGGIALGLIAASALQAWIRADVPLALNLGMAAGALVRRGRTGRAPQQQWRMVTGLLCAGIAAAIQLYIMRVKYPHASYGPIPVLMVRDDLRQPLTFPPFLCFMVPVVWTFVRFWRDRFHSFRDETDTGLVLGSLLYAVLWIVMGKLDEVRIFIPFALAMTPLTVDLALRRIAPELASGGPGELRPAYSEDR